MALTTKKPMIQDGAVVPRKKQPHELTDEDFEKVSVARPAAPAPAPVPEPEKPVIKARKVGRPAREERRLQITHTMTEETMIGLQEVAKKLGIPRASAINLGINKLIDEVLKRS